MVQTQTALNIDSEIKEEFKLFCAQTKITMSEMTEKLWKIHMQTHGVKSARSKKK